MPKARRVLSLAGAAIFAATQTWACAVTDWLQIPLPSSGDAMEIAIELAYPGSDLNRSEGRFVSDQGVVVPYRGQYDLAPQDRLANASIGDQFYYPYPLNFDLEARKQPFVDPGRLRNDAFFRAVWFSSEAAARDSLRAVTYSGQTLTARFRATRKHCVDKQLQTALDEIAARGPHLDTFFASAGGSFNWRVIPGTERLSAHSFGIAVDFSTKLGAYWRWSGAEPGQAADFPNAFPAELVQIMERYGFIWGGKWHHFDGMHFEYRPEMILMARLIQRS